MSINHERADTLNDRSNTIFGFVLLGKADAGDHIEFERSARALQDELTADEPQIDAQLLDDYLAYQALTDPFLASDGVQE